MFTSEFETNTDRVRYRSVGRLGRRAAILLGTALVATGIAASPSLAAWYDHAAVVSHNPHVIEVESDGNNYTEPSIPLVSLSADLHVEIDAGISGKVKSWEAWLLAKPQTGSWVHFSNHAFTKSYSVGSRPKTVNRTETVNIPYGTLAPFLTGHCNVKANQLRAGGMSDAEIFGQDRTIKVELSATADAEYSGVNWGDEVPQEVIFNNPSFDIICKKDPNPEPEVSDEGPTRGTPDVEQASLTVNEVATLNGGCKLYLSGVIESKEANTQVRFRYKDDDGNQSDIKTVSTDHAKTAMFSHQYAVAGTGNKSGQIRIDVVGETTTSPWTNYSVNCRQNAPNHVAGNDVNPTRDPVRVEGAAGSKAIPQGNQSGAATTVVANLGQADLMATPLGLSFAGGKRSWGSSFSLDNPALAQAKGVGPKGNLCRFEQTAFRPFNKGQVASGPFKTKVLRNKKVVQQPTFNLQAHEGLTHSSGWYKFDLELPQGKSVIKVVLDSNKAVSESDEGNNVYAVTVDVNFPCGGPRPGTLILGTAEEADEPVRKTKIGQRLKNRRQAN